MPPARYAIAAIEETFLTRSQIMGNSLSAIAAIEETFLTRSQVMGNSISAIASLGQQCDRSLQKATRLIMGKRRTNNGCASIYRG